MVNTECKAKLRQMNYAMNQALSYMQIEVRVQEEIAQRAVAMTHLRTEQLRKMQLVLKVPRLQQAYIQVHGVDPFIERFTKVLAEYEKILTVKKKRGDSLREHQARSYNNHIKKINGDELIISKVGSPARFAASLSDAESPRKQISDQDFETLLTQARQKIGQASNRHV